MNLLAELTQGAAEALFPPTCVACRGLVEPAGAFRQICSTCARGIHAVTSPHCSTCGHPFFGEVEGERECPHCVGLNPAFDRGAAAVLFKGAARALVIELKYHHGLHVLEDMTEIFRRSPEVLAQVRDAVLVPVPLHPRKQRERGYNQSRLLADALAEAAGGAVRVEDLLVREVDTVTQTSFDRRSRRENLKNAFALAEGAPLNPAQHYVLVDDVFTTGSTLNGCARVLRRAGCLSLDIVTFGHG
jgi:ComF family protein